MKIENVKYRGTLFGFKVITSLKMGGDEMKYIVYWEWDEKDTEELIKKTRQIDELREKYPDRYPKSIGGRSKIIVRDQERPHRGFSLYEGTEEQLNKWEEFYKPELRVTEILHIIKAQEYIEEFESKKKKLV